MVQRAVYRRARTLQGREERAGLDERASAVFRILGAAGISAGFEAVEDGGDSCGGNPQHLREFSCAESLSQAQDVGGGQIGIVQSKALAEFMLLQRVAMQEALKMPEDDAA